MRHARGRLRGSDRGHGHGRPRYGLDIRVAVVTGASSGIGAAVVDALRAGVWRTIGLSRRASNADEHETLDVGDRAAVDAVAARVLARHPRIDLLVNNAGVGARAGFLDAEPERIEEVLRVNYLGTVWVTRAFLPGLHRGAHVANVVSVAGTVAVGPYSASKHAQLAFSRSLAVELAPRGVSVHTVNPGFVETEGFPQRNRFFGLAGRLVAGPELVAARLLDAVEHDRREVFVPRWYRPAAWAQALVPGLVARAQHRPPRS